MYFFVLDSNTDQENFIVIRTAAQPRPGECKLNPSSGIAGKTSFNLTCSRFRDNIDNNLFYYYYEYYENDKDELGNNEHVTW